MISGATARCSAWAIAGIVMLGLSWYAPAWSEFANPLTRT